VSHLVEANKILSMAQAGVNEGILYKAGVLDWNTMIMLTVNDASWAGETKIVDDRVFPRRSQMGVITLLASPDLLEGQEGYIHIIGWSSKMIKRVCRSTMQAETHGMVRGTETGFRLRAAIADMRGMQDPKAWEASCAACMQHVAPTDCQSLESHLNNPVSTGVEDKRLETDLESLRQDLWEHDDGETRDELTKKDPNIARWIDTIAMLADPLTKRMRAERLTTALESGWLTLGPTPESVLQKMSKQKARAKKIKDEDA
jgi:hypothetical protein